jgi:hypothetical protein
MDKPLIESEDKQWLADDMQKSKLMVQVLHKTNERTAYVMGTKAETAAR